MTDDLMKRQRRIIAKVYGRVSAVVFGLCDEGDRVYFGSSNDADILRDMKDEWDAHRITGEDIMSSEQEVAALKKRAKADADRITALEAELTRLRALIAGLDPDHWGLKARVVALKAEALREGGA
jgi:hypothetical protein